MKTRPVYIWLMILLLYAGRMAAQAPVLDSICSGTVRHYAVAGEDGSTYSWILTPPVGPDVLLPSDNDSIEIAWTYPGGIYELQTIQHGLNGCDADAVRGQVFIFDQPSVFAGPDDIVCLGRTYKLIEATADNCIALLWTTSGDGTFDNDTFLNAVYSPGANDILAGMVTLTLSGTGSLGNEEGCGPAFSSMALSIVTVIVPQFAPIGPLCRFSAPPALPDTSLQGMTGNWTPAVINTDFLGTFPYTFSPDDPDQCGVDTTLMISVTDVINPVFEPIGPLCQYSAPPALPATSLNGITGTWEPPAIVTDLPGIFTFTFTPNPDQCGLVTTMDITITPQVTPVFEPIPPICQYTEGPPLPSSSLNGIPGTWFPPVIITAWPGTFTYTFTPDPQTCGTVYTMDIAILPEIVPEFNPVGPLCQFSAPPLLPAISLNGVTGTWNPPAINTDFVGTSFYTFTPDTAFKCAMQVTIAIEVSTEIIPSFGPIGPLCRNSVPPALPDTSLEGLNGTWDPAVISTTTMGTFIFTFTPDEGQCAVSTTMEIVVTDEVTPLFDPIGPLCENNIPPELPGISINGITGSWVPPAIDTSVPGMAIYTFTPDAEQCGLAVSMEIVVTDEMTPTFDLIGPLCKNTIPPVLPGTSLNSITGTWVPPVINTAVAGTTTYIFSPDAGQCGLVVKMDIEVTDEVSPVFDPVGPLCQFSPPVILPAVSNNNPVITGTWVPPSIETSIPGTASYTFTPDPGQCGAVVTMTVEVTGQIIPLFDPIGPLSQDSPPPVLPASSLNGITGNWNPSFIDTSIPGTSTYTFAPDTGQCAGITDIEITVMFDLLELITGPGAHCLGDAAIVPLKVDNFSGVAEFQVKLSYNAEKLWCGGYTGLHPQLSGEFSGNADNYNGIITLNWKSDVPVTFDGQAEICELVFTPKEPGQGQLSWYTGPTESYFYDLSGNLIPTAFFSDDLTIYQPPEVLLSEAKTVCEGANVTIIGIASSTYPPVSYLWTYPDGDTSSVDPFFAGVTADDAGDYTLLATDSLGCSDQKTIRLTVSENPVADFHGAGTMQVQAGYILDAGYGMGSYRWNTGDTTESITVTAEGWYVVEMRSQVGCTGTDSVYIVISEFPEECLFVPNAFTPNNDGLNDTFKPASVCPIVAYKMVIFNRWGEMLYESDDISRGWDGTKNGVPCPGDGYVYKITYRAGGGPGEKEKLKVGTFIIVK